MAGEKYCIKLFYKTSNLMLRSYIFFDSINAIHQLISDLSTYLHNNKQLVNCEKEIRLVNPRIMDDSDLEVVADAIKPDVLIDILRKLIINIIKFKVSSNIISGYEDNCGYKLKFSELGEVSLSFEFKHEIEVDLDTRVLAYHTNANIENEQEVLAYWISALEDINRKVKTGIKMYVSDEIIFETFFILDYGYSYYYGFIDKEDIDVP